MNEKADCQGRWCEWQAWQRGRGTLQRVSEDVLRAVKALYGKRVMAGSEAQLFWMMKRMLQSWSLSFPEVENLGSYSAKPLTTVILLTHLRTFLGLYQTPRTIIMF